MAKKRRTYQQRLKYIRQEKRARGIPVVSKVEQEQVYRRVLLEKAYQTVKENDISFFTRRFFVDPHTLNMKQLESLANGEWKELLELATDIATSIYGQRYHQQLQFIKYIDKIPTRYSDIESMMAAFREYLYAILNIYDEHGFYRNINMVTYNENERVKYGS